MSRIPATMTPNSLNVFHRDRMWAVPKSHINFTKIRELLVKVDQMDNTPASKFWTLGGILPDKESRIQREIKKLNLYLDVPAYLSVITEGKVQVTEAGVIYDGEIMHSVLADRILEHLKAQQDVMPLVKFMARVKENPKEDIAEELFEWMQSGNLPISADGHLIAYKRVGPDYESFHKAPGNVTVYNRPGTVVSMERENVDDNRNATCSSGLHFCSYGYLPNFYNGSGNRTIILQIDPADVGAIPAEYGHHKGRTCRYHVIGEVSSEEAENFFNGTAVITGGMVGSEAFKPPQETRLVEVTDVWADETGDDNGHDIDYSWEDEYKEKFYEDNGYYEDDNWNMRDVYDGEKDDAIDSDVEEIPADSIRENAVRSLTDVLDLELKESHRAALEEIIRDFEKEQAEDKPHTVTPYGKNYPYE